MLGSSIQFHAPPVSFVPIPSYVHYCSSIVELDLRDGDASGSRNFRVKVVKKYLKLTFI